MVIWDESGTIHQANEAFWHLLVSPLPFRRLATIGTWVPTTARRVRSATCFRTRARPMTRSSSPLMAGGAGCASRASRWSAKPAAPSSRRCCVPWRQHRTIGRRSWLTTPSCAASARTSCAVRTSSSSASSQSDRQLGDFVAAARDITEVAARGLPVSRASIWLFDIHRKRIVCQMLFELESGKHNDRAVGMTLWLTTTPSTFARSRKIAPWWPTMPAAIPRRMSSKRATWNRWASTRC